MGKIDFDLVKRKKKICFSAVLAVRKAFIIIILLGDSQNCLRKEKKQI